ncbi:MAG: ankyrin repeat domain-containing protein [Acidimicrobiia bacterium]|nr:ankyrin repeat domain-containing protein [Acidimicrobiia bacterium]
MLRWSALPWPPVSAVSMTSGGCCRRRLPSTAGEDPNRFNPPGTHAHTRPLHQAVAAGHLDVVKVLIERGARLDIRDTIHHGTPLCWVQYCGQPAIAEYLESCGAA